jgi:hypothetical protein
MFFDFNVINAVKRARITITTGVPITTRASVANKPSVNLRAGAGLVELSATKLVS